MTLRDEFERLAEDEGVLIIRAEYEGRELDDYHFPLARGMWKAYQSAHAKQQKRVEELERIITQRCEGRAIEQKSLSATAREGK